MKTTEPQSRRVVLIVDDEPAYLVLLREQVVRGGYSALTAGTAAEALRVLDERDPDVMLLDVRLPDLSGWEVARRIREFSSVPIIMLTVMGSVDDKIHGFRSGADDYVTKPFSQEELLARIEAVLRRAQRERESFAPDVVIQVGDLRMEDGEKRVYWKGEEIELSPTEYRLLWALAENAGTTVMKDRLQQTVWGSSGFGDDNRLKLVIRRLRRRLGDHNAGPQIVAKRGRGYALVSKDGEA